MGRVLLVAALCFLRSGLADGSLLSRRRPHRKQSRRHERRSQNLRTTSTDSTELLSPCMQLLFKDTLPAPEKPPSLASGIDGLYVVHSPIAPERKERLGKLLGEENQSATWVEVLEAPEMGAAAQACAFDPSYPKSYSADMQRWRRIASAVLKHYRIFYDVAVQGHRYAVVMEDDSVLPADWQKKLKRLMDYELPQLDALSLPEAEFVQLSGCLDFLEFHADNAKFTQGPKVTEHLWGPGYGHRCMSGYLISQTGARRLLSVLAAGGKGINSCVDLMLDQVAKNQSAVGGYWFEPRLWPQDQYGGTFHLLRKRSLSDGNDKM